MNLERLKLKWKDELNWDVKHLWDCDEFMADSFNWPEFAAYVVSVKPGIKREKPYKIKFNGLGHVITPPATPKSADGPPVRSENKVESELIEQFKKDYKL